MCFGDDARPPLPPVLGSAVDSDYLVLTSADGTEFGACYAHPFAATVRAAGTEAELHVYPDAVHSFFDRRYDEYREECDDAWRRILDFIERHA